MIHEGAAHGRFQPLHLGHMEYLLAAAERCAFLWVGLTQYDIRSLQRVPALAHREDRQKNPLTYAERYEIIGEALTAAGVSRSQFAVHPFPVETPGRLSDFLPLRVPVFTTVYDDWNRYKIGELQGAGYRVEVLWERNHKEYAGSTVRALIQAGEPGWEAMVPPATRAAVERLGLRDRLIALRPPAT